MFMLVKTVIMARLEADAHVPLPLRKGALTTNLIWGKGCLIGLGHPNGSCEALLMHLVVVLGGRLIVQISICTHVFDKCTYNCEAT